VDINISPCQGYPSPLPPRWSAPPVGCPSPFPCRLPPAYGGPELPPASAGRGSKVALSLTESLSTPPILISENYKALRMALKGIQRRGEGDSTPLICPQPHALPAFRQCPLDSWERKAYVIAYVLGEGGGEGLSPPSPPCRGCLL